MEGQKYTGIGDSPRPNTGIHAERAFTLVELTIVVVTLGIILTIATLSYVNISRNMSINGARKQIDAAMNRAKTAARQENVTYQLRFYTDSYGGNPSSYEFLHNVRNESDGTWTMTPVDQSVVGEETTESGGHTYIRVGNKVKVTGCTEIGGSAIVISFVPEGTTLAVHGSDAGGGTTSPVVTINLSSGSKTGSVSINETGTISAI